MYHKRRPRSFRARVLVTSQRPIPRLFMVDQRSWVSQFIRQLGGRVVYLRSKDLPKLWYKSADIIPAGVGLFTLGVGVENAKIWLWVRAGTCAPLPATVVRGKITVYELAHEMLQRCLVRMARGMRWRRMHTLSPSRQSIIRSLVRYIAAIMRARLCIQPTDVAVSPYS
jgi:hypothetical protein